MPAPGIWGPRLWEVLHKIGYHYENTSPATEILRRDARRELDWIINHLDTIVPCPECRHHIESHIKRYPIVSEKNIGRWIWNLHESVNEQLGKPKGPSYEEIVISKGNLHSLWKEYASSIYESVQMGNLPGKNLSEYARHLFLWKGFLGF